MQEEEHPWLLRTLLETHGRSSLDAAIGCLMACQAAWPPELFRQRSARRRRLALPIAEMLARLGQESSPRLETTLDFEPWLARLDHLLDALGVASEPVKRYQKDSLAAEIVTATSRLETVQTQVWSFRRRLLHDEARYPSLAADIRHDLRRASQVTPATVFDEWDQRLEVGTRSAAFLEIFLNACDDAEFLALAPKVVERLRTLPPLPWWESGSEGSEPDDLRERYAQILPLRPYPFEEFLPILTWFEPAAIRLAASAGSGTRLAPAPSG